MKGRKKQSTGDQDERRSNAIPAETGMVRGEPEYNAGTEQTEQAITGAGQRSKEDNGKCGMHVNG